ncbi:GNAT family N-acetyltransferase [Methanospirillum stamsii]|uniref:GNAT family N-acetyltransferase n=1 Tax=Methanospirillum stamsii TaxID=1277351 RepID=UPI0015E8708C|nr:GNAT family N-acetyltransferase [Methanospirillum stamsii]
MVTIIDKPRVIPAAGTPPKTIEEYIGRVVCGISEVSIAKMVSPPGWTEPFQTPDFDEYTLVLKGTLIIETETERFSVSHGQAIIVLKGSTIRYQTPEGAEYIAICIPAFSPDIVHRLPLETEEKKEEKTTRIQSYHVDTTGPEEIDRIESLWELLREYTIQNNPQFSSKIKKKGYYYRKIEIIEKNKERKIRLDFAVDDKTGKDIGYCICSAAPQSFGEVESIFIHEEARNNGIGTSLMNHALSWMKEQEVSDIRAYVTVGNEVVMPFYKKFGLYPRQYILENHEGL